MFPSVFDGKLRITRAILKKQKKLSSWSQNSLTDKKVEKRTST